MVGVRSLGTQGFKASAQGLGCMSLTPGFYQGAHDEEESIRVIHTAVENGVTLLDTMDLYGPFTNEILIGKALKDTPREKYVIATKWGPMFKDGSIQLNLSRERVREALDAQLKRLGVDYIDLWIVRAHGRDPKTPIEDTIDEMKKCIEEGKVKYIGLSEVGLEDIRRAHAVHPITAVEMEWSLFSRDCEADLVPLCRELGIGFLAYSPLGRGLLTGKLNLADLDDKDHRKTGNPRFEIENYEKNMKLVKNVVALAEKKGCTPGQLALAWVHHRGDDVIPIPGTKRTKYLLENIAAADISLSAEELAELEAAVPVSEVAGDRYYNMKHVSYHHGSEH